MPNENIPSTICIPIERNQKAHSTIIINNRPHILVGQDDQKACYVPMAGRRRGKKKAAIVCPTICIVGEGVSEPTIPCSGDTQRLTNATIGFPYSNQLAAIGGTAPYVFVVVAGALPPGITLSAAGLLSGVAEGDPGIFYNFTVQVTDVNGCIGTQMFRIRTADPI